MTASVLARIAALKSASTADLKTMWRALLDTDPPAVNRRLIERQLAHQIQVLSFGGLKSETVERLDAMADEIEAGGKPRRRAQHNERPIAGTKLIREWHGIEHAVMVRDDGYEYDGRPYKSLSAIARGITGTRWSGPLFFGLRRGQKNR